MYTLNSPFTAELLSTKYMYNKLKVSINHM